MVNVYAWPPVGAVGREWTVEAPIGVSRSLLTGAEYVSAAQRRRRVAVLEASSRFSPYQAGAGYMEALKRLLDGGIHLVRLHFAPTRFDCDVPQNDSGLVGGEFFEWHTPPEVFGWQTTGSEIFRWFSGARIGYTQRTTDAGVDAIRLTGLPANTLVALPGDFVTVFQDDEDPTGETHMIVAPATTGPGGAVTVRLASRPSFGAGVERRANLGTQETAVFKVDAMPRAVEPSAGDWSYTWAMTEVFEDERGPFTEVNPWN